LAAPGTSLSRARESGDDGNVSASTLYPIQAPGTDRTGGDSTATTRRTELASFLRSRRERIRPEEVGFAPGGRRRTPGLRREEVAQLAGVGVTWYTWLEQGRDINVSEQVLEAIARTLRLDRTERRHLFTLAGVPLTPGTTDCSALTPNMQVVLDQLSPFPATVVNKRYDVLAYNDAYRKVIVDLDQVPVDERNVLWLCFTYEDWLCSFLDLDDMHAALVAGFRSGYAEHVGEPAWRDLTERLLELSPRFAELWSRHDVAGPGTRVKLVDNPKAGVLRMEPANLWLGQNSEIRVSIYAPADEETKRKLDLIVNG
jgi:transcriptional regulator with XRE-family HTH domain